VVTKRPSKNHAFRRGIVCKYLFFKKLKQVSCLMFTLTHAATFGRNFLMKLIFHFLKNVVVFEVEEEPGQNANSIECKTPRGLRGGCIPFNECTPLVNEKFSSRYVTYIQSINCGYDYRNPKVKSCFSEFKK
jgi:hypothetical protein